MNKMERLIASLPTIKVGNVVITCHAFTRADSPNILRISGEDGPNIPHISGDDIVHISGGYSQMFLDYYGEYTGGDSFIHASLLKWAEDNHGYWEWENPSNIAFYPL